MSFREREFTVRGLSVKFSIQTKENFLTIIPSNPHHDIIINTIFITFNIIKTIIIVYSAIVTACRCGDIPSEIHDGDCKVFRVID